MDLPNIVIISTFKPLLPEFIVEHTNSLRSWKKLRCNPKIVIIGDDAGVEEFCKNENVLHHPFVNKNKYGTPLVSSILEEGWKYADDKDIVIFLNGDIILDDKLCDTIEAFVKEYPNYYEKTFLLTAIRQNWKNFDSVNFNENDWFKNILSKTSPDSPTAIDLFVHRKGTITGMPQSGIAKYAYDSWILLNAFEKFDIVVDITETCKIIHHFGKWYQNKMVCDRNLMTRELIENARPINMINHNLKKKINKSEVITDCPLYTKYENDTILFVNKS